MRRFDPRAVGRYECRAWETYYRRKWAVGAYPPGQEDYDLLRDDLSDAELAAARERIAALGPPPEDPVGGEGVAGWTG